MKLLQNYYANCYILVNNRSVVYVQKFLNFFLRIPVSMTDEYEIPQYSDKTVLSFKDYMSLLEHLERHTNEAYFLYFKGFDYNKFKLKDKIAQFDELGEKAKSIFEEHFICSCFYLETGELILGISCPTQEPNLIIETYFFNSLKQFSESDVGYITYEQPPPSNKERFVDISNKWKKDKAYYENI